MHAMNMTDQTIKPSVGDMARLLIMFTWMKITRRKNK